MKRDFDTLSEDSEDFIEIKLRNGCKIPQSLLDAPPKTFNLVLKNALYTLSYLKKSAIEAQVSDLVDERTSFERERNEFLLKEREKESQCIEERISSQLSSKLQCLEQDLNLKNQDILMKQQQESQELLRKKDLECLDARRNVESIQNELEFFKTKKQRLEEKLKEEAEKSSVLENEIKTRIENDVSQRYIQQIDLYKTQIEYERNERLKERESRELSDKVALEKLLSKSQELQALTDEKLKIKNNSSLKGSSSEEEVIKILKNAFPAFNIYRCSKEAHQGDIKLQCGNLKVMVDVKSHDAVKSSSNSIRRNIEGPEIEKMKDDMQRDPTQDIGILIATKTYFANIPQLPLYVEILNDGRPLIFITKFAENEDPVSWIKNALSLSFLHVSEAKRRQQDTGQLTSLEASVDERLLIKNRIIEIAEQAVKNQEKLNKENAERGRRLLIDLNANLDTARNMKL